MTEDCQGLGFWLGHKFTPRYNDEPTLTRISGIDALRLADVLKASRKKTYVCDVCVRCGATTKDQK